MSFVPIPHAKFLNQPPRNLPENLPQGTEVIPKNPLIEKCLKQLENPELLGGPYLKDYLNDQKRRNCRPNTIRCNFSALKLFLSYLKERGRISLETITREDLSSLIEDEQDRGMRPNTVYTRLRWLYACVSYLVDREVAHPDLLKRKIGPGCASVNYWQPK